MSDPQNTGFYKLYGVATGHWMCGDKFALTVPLSTQVAFVQSSKSLCRVQPRFLQAFAFEEEVRKVRMRKKFYFQFAIL